MSSSTIQIVMAIICLLASITIYFQPKSELYLKLFPVFLMITNAVSAIGVYMGDHNINNTVLYNVFSIVEVMFYFFIFYEMIRNKKLKRIIIYMSCVYFLVAIYDMIVSQKAHVFHSLSYSVGSLFLVILCVFYFYELFQLPQTNSLLRQPSFWICTSILFSTCCTFPLFGFAMFFHTPPKFIINNIQIILLIVNIFTYSLYTIAFLCRIKTSKSMLSS